MTYTKNIISDYVTLRLASAREVGDGGIVWEVPNVWYANQRSNVCTVELQAGLVVGEWTFAKSSLLQADTVTPIVPDGTLEDDITDSIVEGHPEFVAAGDPVNVNANLVDGGLIVYYENGAQNASDVASQKSPLGIGHSPTGKDTDGFLMQSCGKLLVTARPHQIRLKFEDLQGDDYSDSIDYGVFTLRFDYYDSDDVAREMHKEMEHML